MTFKPVLVVVLIVSLVWGGLVLPVVGHPITLLELLFTVPLWGYVVITAADIVSAWSFHPTPYLQSFYRTLSGDLRVAIGNGLVTASVYHFSTAAYGPAAFDIASAAVSFALMTLFNVLDIARGKIAGRPMKRSFVFGMLVFTLACYSYVYLIFLKIASGHFAIGASTWLQLTIVFMALFGYVETRRILFVIQVERLELSPFMLSLFGPNGMYGQLQATAAEFNRRIAQQKATAAQAHASKASAARTKKRRSGKRKR